MPFLPAVRRALRVAMLTSMALCAGAFGATTAGAAEIGGVAFKDVDRDGVMQVGEEPLAGKRIYVFDEQGGYVAHAPTDAAGRYAISGLAPARYEVRYGTVDWWELWQDWAPSTTGSEWPRTVVDLATSAAVVNFGWRPIVRSADVAAPISTYVAPSGLRIHSYNDVFDARRLYDALMAGSLHGAEAPFTTIHFDYRPDNFCDVSAVKAGDTWGDYRALCYVAYTAWLDSGDTSLFHEYGHAWSLYNAYIVQQDPELASYLQARGLTGDPRLRTSSTWNPREMVAEDYRQLFGTVNAAAWPQDNQEIPPPQEVPGLREFLAGSFMLAPAPAPPPATTAIHVAALSGQVAKAAKAWSATVSAIIRDAGDLPIGGAAVTLRWTTKSATGQLSCTTGAGGDCAVRLDLPTKVDGVTFTVAAVARDGSTYDRAADRASSLVLKRPR